MRLLIAGWHGQIARALVELAPARDDVSTLSIGRAALELCRPVNMRGAMLEAKPDVLINTAAYTDVDAAEQESETAFQMNHAGAEAFAAVAARKGIPVIHLSTGYVFDGRKQGAYTEDDAPAPRSVYGRSKLEGERAVAAVNPRHVILRTSWVFSAHGRNFVKSILDQAASHDTIDVVDDQAGTPTYAPHLAAIILEIAARLAGDTGTVPWGTYHVASRQAVTWCEFARDILQVSGELGGPTAQIRGISSGSYPTPAPRLANASLDSSKLEQAFGLAMAARHDSLRDCVGQLLAER